MATLNLEPRFVWEGGKDPEPKGMPGSGGGGGEDRDEREARRREEEARKKWFGLVKNSDPAVFFSFEYFLLLRILSS
jgi:hypothetical protein